MIPLRLVLEGFLSYRERQVVDFEPLVADHVFGIFGPTGAGKSGLLDAMIFALFNRVPRLQTRDLEYASVLNLASSVMVVDFTFLAGERDEERFRSIVRVRRTGKGRRPFDAERRLLRLHEDREEPLDPGPDMMESIVGMSYEHFCRAVILPQGQFREFLDLRRKERGDMILSLFHLERFDLQDRASALERETDIRVREVQASLEAVKDATPETMAALEKAEAEHRAVVSECDTRLRAWTRDVEERERLQNLADQRALLLEQEATLSAQRSEREQDRRRWERAEQALILAPRLTALDGIENEVTRIEKERQRHESTLASHSEQQREVQRELDACAPFEARRTLLLETETSARAMRRVREQDLAMMECDARIANEEGLVEAGRARKTVAETRLAEVRQTLDRMRQDRMQWAELPEILAWKSDLDTARAHQKGVEQEEASLRRRWDEEQEQWAHTARELDSEAGNIEADLHLRLERLKARIAEREQQLRHLHLRHALAIHADTLAPGLPCPLCGAVEHPHPAEATDAALVTAEEREVQNLRDQASRLQASIERLSALRQARDRTEKELHRAAGLLQDATAAVDAVLARFRWPAWDPHHLEALEEATIKDRELEERIDALTTELTTAQNDCAECETEVSNLHLHLAALRAERERIQGQRSVMLEQDSLSCDPFVHSEEEWTRIAEEAQRDRLALEARHADALQRSHQTETALVLTRAQLDALNRDLDQARTRMQHARTELLAACGEAGFADLEELRTASRDESMRQALREQVRIFDEEWQACRKNLAQVHTLIGDRDPDIDALHNAREEKNRAQMERDEAQKTLGRLEAEQQRLARDIVERARLLDLSEHLSRRLETIRVVYELLKGKKFVDFAATIFLRNLCAMANQRFLRLTHHALQLELDEDGAFVVRDFLHDGAVRSVRTLSGGQSFQAALCLALALADTIHTDRQSSRSFFFLDEGFGSLDRASLREVMETLRTLRHEHRVVGVISHVEDMQDEIPAAIAISLNEDGGSRIAVL